MIIASALKNTVDRENNFSLIRILAALAVLITHSFSLVTGDPATEPFRNRLDMSIGSIAVDLFFITSGFLVTSSLLHRQNTYAFIWARFLRIFPALFVMLVFTVTVIGPVFTTLQIPIYFLSRETYFYFLKCVTLFTGVTYHLPGVFESNPYKGIVNGSLWTMPYEVKMYAILAILWASSRVALSYRIPAFKFIVIAATVSSAGVWVFHHFYFSSEFAKLFLMFFAGASFFVVEKRVSLKTSVFWFLVFAVIVATAHARVFTIVYTCSISYILFYLAYVPAGFIRKYNRIGDYSYGIYNLCISDSTIDYCGLSWNYCSEHDLEFHAVNYGLCRFIVASTRKSGIKIKGIIRGKG